jgi:tRNA(fMet)-specific endonuclease VapC
MSLYVLDTDSLTLLQEGQPAILTHVAAHRPEEIAITIISVEEQLSGWYRRLRSAKKPEELARVYDRLTVAVRSLSRLPILSFRESAIHRARSLLKAKLNVGKMDLCIAAIALEHQATVVTCNLRDFQRVPGLVVEDWSKVSADRPSEGSP